MALHARSIYLMTPELRDYFRQIGKKGGLACKGLAATREKTRKAATHRWLLEECAKHEELVKELQSYLPPDYQSLPEKRYEAVL